MVLKRTLNGRGGAKSHSVVCGNCELELMASAPNRPIDLLVSCPECRAINDLSVFQNTFVFLDIALGFAMLSFAAWTWRQSGGTVAHARAQVASGSR